MLVMERLELESDAPELSTYTHWWKFWISFAVPPLIFVLLNCMVPPLASHRWLSGGSHGQTRQKLHAD
jgi:hypothetical protein